MLCRRARLTFENRTFNLPYNLIKESMVRIDFWKWKNHTFNEYFGTVEKPLFKLIRKG